MQFFQINEAGKPIETLEINDEHDPMVVEGWEGSFYDPTYDFQTESWVEGMSDEEINQLRNKQPPPEPTTDELKSEIEVLKSVLDFIILNY